MADKHQHSVEEKKALQIRLRKIGGQLKSIEKMIQDDVDCSEVLTQTVSARRALKSFAETVIHGHLHSCIEHAADPREGQKKLKDLLSVLRRYVD
jgi:CsoR family transcriptional regulator, copper-sensing transcriptional repressor